MRGHARHGLDPADNLGEVVGRTPVHAAARGRWRSRSSGSLRGVSPFSEALARVAVRFFTGAGVAVAAAAFLVDFAGVCLAVRVDVVVAVLAVRRGAVVSS